MTEVKPWLVLSIIILALSVNTPISGQTTSSGALAGMVFDPSDAVLPGVLVRIANRENGFGAMTVSDERGRFNFLLLPPGPYELQASSKGFETLVTNAIVSVTERGNIELHLRIRNEQTQVDVSAEPAMVQTADSVLGKVVNQTAVSDFPLVTRNFAQIVSLSPGVIGGVYNAGELGLGGTALSQIAKSNDGIYVHGARSYDNNFKLDGISVSDVQGSGAGSGGIPIPNPDSIREFKVQTGLYDAAYGRYAGANVNLITKSGGNALHGTVFEFLRNEALNANDFFLNQTGQRRPILRQNQFGFAIGGPIQREKLFFFGSYQGTRQVNGLAAGQSRTACTASLSEPPLSDRRTSAELGKMFGGMTGAQGGMSIKSDGSNINPVAMALLNFRLPDGSFLIPTPQTIDATKPLFQQGFSVFSDPCHFGENQFSANVDYLPRASSKISARLFLADDVQTVTFPGNGLNAAGNIRGFPSPGTTGFRVFSLSHTYASGSSWLNEAHLGFVRTVTQTEAKTPFKWSDVGAAEGEMSRNNELPSLKILGSVSIASGFPRTITQNSIVLSDALSFVRGAHTLRLGGSVTRLQDDPDLSGLGSFVQFLSWPDFLLGRSAHDNGTPFSNVFASFDDFGLTNRQYRVWEGTGFAQDDYRVNKSLAVNIGVRYERLGQFADRLGRNASFDIGKANPNPPSDGSVAGYVVSSNFQGELPPGVSRANNSFGTDGAGQNTIVPRIGFVFRPLPRTSRLALRGGYGFYYSRPTGQAFYQNMLGAPFSQFRLNAGPANANAAFENPFAQPFPTPQSFPFFPAYSPATNTTIYSIASDFRPAQMQQYSLNVQVEILPGWLLEVGYVDTRGSHLLGQRSLNQALPATSGNPIRGTVENRFDNIRLRVPIPGVPADSLDLVGSDGKSRYDGLEVSLEKRLNRGLQFLASYTFSKTLDTNGSDINSVSSGNALPLGDQNSASQRWGRASFDRTQRFVLSTTWTLPGPQRKIPRFVLGDWSWAAIATVQSGTALTIADTNSMNVFGISEDRAQLSGSCARSQLIKGGPVQSKLTGYFNTSCFAGPPILGTDGVATAFGNSGTGIVNGPGQANLDLSLSKNVASNWLFEGCSLQLRVEFYNALNRTQFSNPDANFSSPTFGVIGSTSVNARVGQVAIKLAF